MHDKGVVRRAIFRFIYLLDGVFVKRIAPQTVYRFGGKRHDLALPYQFGTFVDEFFFSDSRYHLSLPVISYIVVLPFAVTMAYVRMSFPFFNTEVDISIVPSTGAISTSPL